MENRQAVKPSSISEFDWICGREDSKDVGFVMHDGRKHVVFFLDDTERATKQVGFDLYYLPDTGQLEVRRWQRGLHYGLVEETAQYTKAGEEILTHLKKFNYWLFDYEGRE
jgi:hypothetical protein